jgi:hypothetical protein
MQRDKLCIVDASDSTLAPRTLLESQVARRSLGARRHRGAVPGARADRHARRQHSPAVRRCGGRPGRIAPAARRIAATLWAEDGAVYFWGAKNGAAHSHAGATLVA